MTPASRSQVETGLTLDRVRDYWDNTHDAYLTHVGTTFQAGRIAIGSSARESNLWLARAAGLATGQQVLDAGCGVCGPSIDIARHIPGLRIVGITLSSRQATTAARLVQDASLAGRIRVVNGDYHALPFPDRTFDAVLFLESLGYGINLTGLILSVFHVIRPGGSLYVKDVFRRDRLWSDQEARELAEFDQAYSQRTPTIHDCIEAASAAGFESIQSRELSNVTTAHAHQAMFDDANAKTLSAFGRVHYRRHTCLPVYFAELTARRPR